MVTRSRELLLAGPTAGSLHLASRGSAQSVILPGVAHSAASVSQFGEEKWEKDNGQKDRS